MSARTGRLLRLAVIFYFLEAGAFLVMAPWSRYWAERVVARAPYWSHGALLSPYFRGFLAGLGLLHIAFAVWELEGWRRETAELGSPEGSESPLNGIKP